MFVSIRLGCCYCDRTGVEQDYEEAYKLYQLSADHGFPVAMFAVGDCYCLGLGVEKNLELAREWYQKSLEAGYEPGGRRPEASGRCDGKQ